MKQINLGNVIKIAVLELALIGIVFFFIGFNTGRDYERSHPKGITVEIVE